MVPDGFATSGWGLGHLFFRSDWEERLVEVLMDLIVRSNGLGMVCKVRDAFPFQISLKILLKDKGCGNF